MQPSGYYYVPTTGHHCSGFTIHKKLTNFQGSHFTSSHSAWETDQSQGEVYPQLEENPRKPEAQDNKRNRVQALNSIKKSNYSPFQLANSFYNKTTRYINKIYNLPFKISEKNLNELENHLGENKYNFMAGVQQTRIFNKVFAF